VSDDHEVARALGKLDANIASAAKAIEVLTAQGDTNSGRLHKVESSIGSLLTPIQEQTAALQVLSRTVEGLRLELVRGVDAARRAGEEAHAVAVRAHERLDKVEVRVNANEEWRVRADARRDGISTLGSGTAGLLRAVAAGASGAATIVVAARWLLTH
jgi:chromosome segregation ATPase